jgi:uncharacterized protein YyaL (SSP411 family)
VVAALRMGMPAGLVTAVLLCFLLLPTLAAGNDLKHHPSHYLALHGDDPVQWRDWGEAALREARELNRPLFISSGYFACHWCHVMQRESYRDATTAELLNGHFVPVKLDRELHPALDDHLIRFVERTRGQAGWPLNVFLTPEGYPMLGLTYLPPGEFRAVLERVAERWGKGPESLARLARQASAELAAEQDTSAPAGSSPAPGDVASALGRSALVIGDELGGGFGEQTRFPMEPQLLALLETQRHYGGSVGLAPFLRTTLDEMARRGLRDHLAGGFFRYTVDPDWRTPHFEKMLYNQALLARVYIAAASVLETPRYLDVAAETLDFVLRHMAGTDGGFIASLSAVDAAGEEGAAYLWDAQRLASVLEPRDVEIARAWWSLEPEVSPDTGWLPQRLRTPAEAAAVAGVDASVLDTRLPAIRAALLAERESRRPPRDHKQLAAWNGLLLWALADMVEARDEERFRNAAAGVAAFLGTLWDGDRLYRARDGVRVLGEAGLEDYAYVAAGLDAWARQGGGPDAARLAQVIAGAGWDRFYDGTGWRTAAVALLPDMPREPALADGALPSPSAVLMAVSATPGTAPLVPDAPIGVARRLSVPAVIDTPFWYASHAGLFFNHGTVSDRAGTGVVPDVREKDE